jgi:FkbM family methyltransferase
MSSKESFLKPLTSLYSLARKSRLLDTGFGQSAFAASYFLYKKYLEDPYFELAKRHPALFQGGHILDLGANIGYTASVFSRFVSPGYKVFAFEPELFNYRLLEREAAKNALKIVPVRSAVGDVDGTIELWENRDHHGDHRILTDQFRQTTATSSSVTVPITKIDTFVGKQTGPFPVCFIKVDVQGYELPVCKGMQQTLALNPHASLALEYMPQAMRDLGFRPEELLQWLADQDYRAHRIESHGRLSSGLGGAPVKDGYCDLLFSRKSLQASRP